MSLCMFIERINSLKYLEAENAIQRFYRMAVLENSSTFTGIQF